MIKDRDCAADGKEGQNGDAKNARGLKSFQAFWRTRRGRRGDTSAAQIGMIAGAVPEDFHGMGSDFITVIHAVLLNDGLHDLL